MARKEYTGGAASAKLAAGIASNPTTVAIDTASGWPVGTYPFVAVIDRGVAGKEEKKRFSGRSGTTLTVDTGGNGVDGTSAVAHDSGAAIEHCLDAESLTDFARHVYDTTSDDHTQYLNVARHDITARHAYGAALGSPGTPAAVGTTASAGAGGAPAREDHVHVLTAGIAGAGLALVSGVLHVDLDDLSLVFNGDMVQIADLGVTTAKLAAASVTGAKLDTSAADASTLEVASGSMRVKDAGITVAKAAAEVLTITVPFSQPGTLATGTGKLRWRAPRAYTIKHVRLAVNTAPTGAAILVDVNKNGTTVFTTQANRPTIAVSAFAETAITAPDVTALAAGDYVTVDIDQVGSTIAGADLVVNVYLESA